MKTAIIVGAGPAGLTAAWELLTTTDIKPVIVEQSAEIGGISRTVRFKGNRMDIGGHRFFSKSQVVMDWWARFFPLQGAPSRDDKILEREVPLSTAPNAPDPEQADRVMLVRSRLSRIFYLRKFFDYPVTLSGNTIKNLGLWRMFKIGMSYIWRRIVPVKPEKSLEDFFINRFGKQLYLTFFKDYTEKVWGVPCSEISSEWGAQRIKGLSLIKTILHALRGLFRRDKSINQKNTETSLIEQFLYPKFGPGQLWEAVADDIRARGGQIMMEATCVGMQCQGDIVQSVQVRRKDGSTESLKADYVFSTMPVKDLVACLGSAVPTEAAQIAAGLQYRDFITVGLLLNKLAIVNTTKRKTVGNLVPDNWIYVQERDVKVGRLQIFNNWSPYMVADPEKVWIGLEYFCNEGDEMWRMPDADFAAFAVAELDKIGIIQSSEVIDSVVVRVPKTYPAYFGKYAEFNKIRQETDRMQNLFLVGRNGLHRYNNMDHSMLTAMEAVRCIREGITDKAVLWAVNAEEEYHEEKEAKK